MSRGEGFHLENIEPFVSAYLEKTDASRRFALAQRTHHVDKSSIAFGATPETQRLAYPIVVERAAGSKLWDIDGNEYVDILQGLGANLFGHNPDFVREAIATRLGEGFPIGAQTELVGAVVNQIVQLTGMPRICFSNTGTEAIMTAIRVARAKTGRDKIAVFTDSYHGHSDTVLMRATLAEYARKKIQRRFGRGGLGKWLGNFSGKKAVPASVGIPRSVARDVVVLEYGSPRALD
ncbi:MAG: aminotransferase class III-fold pyridoxal phosphate-dependent enzyme, partial [Verrucomicrobiota bacterium]